MVRVGFAPFRDFRRFATGTLAETTRSVYRDGRVVRRRVCPRHRFPLLVVREFDDGPRSRYIGEMSYGAGRTISEQSSTRR